MIGFSKNTYLIACNSYIYLFSLYGRTVVDHVLSRRRRVYDVVGRVDDALRNVGRVYDRPLCACLSHHQQEQADCQNCFCSHFYFWIKWIMILLVLLLVLGELPDGGFHVATKFLRQCPHLQLLAFLCRVGKIFLCGHLRGIDR